MATRHAAGWLALALLLVGCEREASERVPAWLEGDAAYAGREVCATCHREEAARWQDSHHDRAMQPASADTVLGDFGNATFSHAGVETTFTRSGNEYRVRTEGPDGAMADYQVAYTFGVEPLQQYLIEFPAGRLQALSVSWDTRPVEEGGQRWFHLYPDEDIPAGDPLHWTGPNQNWNYMCAECHSTDLRKNYDARTDTYATRWEEIDVSCEACHGPASLHVAWAEAAERGESVPDEPTTGLVVRLRDADDPVWTFDETGIARREPARRSRTEVETCARCHSRRSVARDPYVHDRPLLDTHRLSLLEPGLYHPDGQILEEVYVYGSFLQSRMYAEGVTCSDCHDPHSLELVREGNALCAGCHLPAKYEAAEHHHHQPGAEGSACVDCHMRAEVYMVVDPRRDHSFRVPRPDLSEELGSPDACSDCHAERGAEWVRTQFGSWYPDRLDVPHYGQALHAGREGLVEAPQALASLVQDRQQPALARATALELLAGYLGPGAMAAVEAGVHDSDPLLQMAAAPSVMALDPSRRLEATTRLLTSDVLAVRLAAARALVGAEAAGGIDPVLLAEAVGELEESLAVNADRVESRLMLGSLAAQRGDVENAGDQYRAALELEPDSVEVRINLADLERQRGDESAAAIWLKEARDLAPESAEAAHALGLSLVRQDRLQEAIALLAEAAEAAPDEVRFAYVYAVALWSDGKRREALASLRAAHQRRPAERGVLMALVTYSIESGAADEAREYARQLIETYPHDPEARRLYSTLTGSR